MRSDLDVVTGAFSYTGGFIARELVARGRRVRTLTNHPHRSGAEDLAVEVAPLQFHDSKQLADSLRDADTLYNTYWVRFPRAGIGFEDAVANTRTLMSAAAAAGIRKVVHVSVSNPTTDSRLAYYAGKARTEDTVRASGLEWAVVRPTLIFGPGDILLNNIAWLLRRTPVFVIPGDGHYRVQPVAGEDVADIAIESAADSACTTVDAAGPDVISYRQLVENIASAVHRRPPMIHVRPRLTLLAGNVIGLFVRDVVLTRQELEGLMDELLVSREPARGKRHIATWLQSHSDVLGMRYASELDRHFR